MILTHLILWHFWDGATTVQAPALPVMAVTDDGQTQLPWTDDGQTQLPWTDDGVVALSPLDEDLVRV
jgi:predicted ATPase